MKRNRKGEMPEISREVYKSVKRFDRQQFTGFCTDLYMYGYEDGRDSVPGVDVGQLYEAVAAIKGIGPKKLAEIKAKMDEIFGEKE